MSARRGVASVMGLALITSLLVAPGAPVVAAAPDPAPGRLAFTDARDSIRQVELDELLDEQDRPYLVPQGSGVNVEDLGRHSGEARGDAGYWTQWDGNYAFVSTRDEADPPASASPSPDPTASPSASPSPTPAPEDPDGEVWYRYRAADNTTAYLQVTDDDARASHPEAWVESTDCYYGTGLVDVAFASDRSGNWDIWVAHLVAEQVIDETGSPTCGPYEVVGIDQVTDDPGDDLWPAWSARSLGEGYQRTLVFSSTRSDPMGDIYEVDVPYWGPDSGAWPGDVTPVQLTEGPAADSHPAPRPRTQYAQTCPGDGDAGAPRWLAFTRADDADPRGGLAVLDLDDPGGGVMSLGVSAAAEPAWSPDGQFVAYRSTAEDPDGDVLVGRFERTCPPDLAVTRVLVEPVLADPGQPILLLDPVDVIVVVTNAGTVPASGSVTIDFTELLEPPPECDGAQVCTLPVPTLQPGDVHELRWTASPDETELYAQAVGDGELVATVAVEGDRADPVPENDSLGATFSVIAPTDVQIPQEGERPGLTAEPSSVDFTTADPVPVVITVLAYNPAAWPVEVSVAVRTDSDLLTADGSRTARVEVPLGAGQTRPVPFDFLAFPPDLGTSTVVVVDAELAVLPPAQDPDPTNNTDTIEMSLTEETGVELLAPATPRLRLASLVRAQAVTAGLTAGVPRAAAHALAAVPAVLPAAVPAAVPAPAKPPIDDSVALADITGVGADFGAAESHPTFVWDSPNEQLMLLYTWRPDGSRISDVLSSDGTDRRVLVEDPTDATEMAHPSYSPDGRFIAFHRYTCDRESVPVIGPSADYFAPTLVGCVVVGSDIVVATADGSDPVVIYPSDEPRPEGALDLRPAWSPDGTSIAFTRVQPEQPVEGEPDRRVSAIWVASGLDLAADPVDLVAETVAQLTQPHWAAVSKQQIDEFDDEAAWSPDGARIAFTRARLDTGQYTGADGGIWVLPDSLDPGAYDSDIWLVEVASGDAQPMLGTEVGAPADDDNCPETTGVEQPDVVCVGGDDRGADWSPDGTRIVYEHTGWLYLADPEAGTDLGPLTGPRSLHTSDSLPLYPDDPLLPAPADPEDPAASAYPGLDWAQDPAWSPNGDRIAFAGQPRGRPDQRGIYWLTVPSDPAAREIREIAQQPQPEIEPDWQPTADLAITLTAVPASVQVGAVSQVTATVTNEGPGRAIAAVATFTLPAGLAAGTLPAGCAAGPPIACTLGDLADRATVTVTIPVTGTAAATHTVQADTSSRTVDPDPADNTATTSIEVLAASAAADLAIALVAAPATVGVGGASQLTATVSNLGPDVAADAVATVTMPAELVAGTVPAGCVAGPPITCTVGTVGPGAVVQVQIPVNGTVVGTHTATATVTGSTPDPVAANNQASATVQVVAEEQSADVGITLVANPPSVGVGVEAQVTATITNNGPSPALGTTATLTVPPDLAVGPLPGGCVAGIPIVCDFGELAPAVSAQVLLRLTGAVQGEFTISGTTSSTTPDPDPANNSASTPLQIVAAPPQADLSVAIEVDPVPGYVGGEQTVTLTIANVGLVPSAATVTLTLPDGAGAPAGEECLTEAGCAFLEIAAGAQVIRTIELEPEEALRGRARARITGPLPDPDPSDNRASARIVVLQPTLAFNPTVGMPGRVTMLYGVDFPPNGRVGLKWDEGLLNFRLPIRVGDDGTFQFPVLALHRDRLGPRRMSATRVEGELFGEVFGDYLVVPRTQFPPDFNGRG